MRLFVAIELSGDVLPALLRAQQALKQQGRGNFTRTENLHLTLAFIGETDRVDDARAALEAIQCRPFWLQVEKTGTFQDGRSAAGAQPGLIWAGVSLSPELTALHSEVSRQLRHRGFVLEKRPFRPHITLCRRFIPSSRQDHLAEAEQALGRAKYPVKEVVLMESFRDEEGRVIYRRVDLKKLS